MEQHPIPQQITSYQFRLVGDMTLKQFFQLAGGIIVALIFYSTPLHALIKWPIIFFFVLLGVALAFLPFEDRPLENWIVAFFRSIYSPTVYSWREVNPARKYFAEETAAPEQTVTGAEGEKLNAYLAETDGQKPTFARTLESYEKNFLSGIGSLFGAKQTVGAVGATAAVTVPDQLVVPQNHPVAVNTTQQHPLDQVVSSRDIQAVATDISPLGSKGLSATQNVEFSSQAAPPSPPTVPNTISGQVLDGLGKIIESAILEIRDASGRPVRALRTNKLGHFTVVTPLINGPYEIVAEKEGLVFESLRFDAVGEIIPPIVIRANAPEPQTQN